MASFNEDATYLPT